jgi:hypothetical protein
MIERIDPDLICSVDRCTEPAAISTRGAAADPVVEEAPAELVPLCAHHAEQAEAGRSRDEG